VLVDNIVWKVKHSVGNDVIDDQHRVLFEILSNCVEAGDKTEVKYLILVRDLLGYCQEHFLTEEKLLAEKGYPDLEAHALEHSKILAAVEKIVFKLYNGIPLNFDSVDKFVFNWVVKHILERDMKYKDYI